MDEEEEDVLLLKKQGIVRFLKEATITSSSSIAMEKTGASHVTYKKTSLSLFLNTVTSREA